MHSPRLLTTVTMLNLMTDTNRDSVKTETLFLHECRINLLQNRLLQNTHSSSLFLPVLEPHLIFSFGSILHCVQMFIHCCSQMFLEQHITQGVASRKDAAEYHHSAQKCSVLCLPCWVARHKESLHLLHTNKSFYTGWRGAD